MTSEPHPMDREPGNEVSGVNHCLLAEAVLYAFALVFLVFGFFYLLAPGPSISSINTVAVTLGLHLPQAPTAPPEFLGWLGFTFAYMMGAAFCSFQAARIHSRERLPYVNVLMVLKGTSSLTGFAFFFGQHEYPFYLATALVDGAITATVWMIAKHLRAHLEMLRPPPRAEGETKRE